MTIQARPLVEINQQALRLLYQELGIVDAVRFLKQFMVGLGDYTQERDALFGQKTLDEITAEIEKRRASPPE
ncbi:MAG: hypothetical protein H5T65_10955 [Chloroflexi bacterium]|nr:hypothetical protein [Chloroflexota bacterium]